MEFDFLKLFFNILNLFLQFIICTKINEKFVLHKPVIKECYLYNNEYVYCDWVPKKQSKPVFYSLVHCRMKDDCARDSIGVDGKCRGEWMMISHRFYINITSGDQSAISDPFYADLALQFKPSPVLDLKVVGGTKDQSAVSINVTWRASEGSVCSILYHTLKSQTERMTRNATCVIGGCFIQLHHLHPFTYYNMTVACKRRMVGGGLSGYPGDDVALIFKSPSHVPGINPPISPGSFSTTFHPSTPLLRTIHLHWQEIPKDKQHGVMAEVKVSCRHISHFSMLHYYLKRSGGETTDVVRHFEYTDYGGDVVLEKESWYVVMLESGNNEGFNVSAPPSHILITPYQMAPPSPHVTTAHLLLQGGMVVRWCFEADLHHHHVSHREDDVYINSTNNNHANIHINSTNNNDVSNDNTSKNGVGEVTKLNESLMRSYVVLCYSVHRQRMCDVPLQRLKVEDREAHINTTEHDVISIGVVTVVMMSLGDVNNKNNTSTKGYGGLLDGGGVAVSGGIKWVDCIRKMGVAYPLLAVKIEKYYEVKEGELVGASAAQMNESQQLNDAYYQQQQQQKIHYQQQQIHQQNQINQQHQQNILYQQQLQQHQLQQQIHQQNQINQQHQQNTQNQQQVQHHQLQQLLYQQNQIKQQHQQQLQASPHHNLVLTWTPPPCFKSSPILHHHLIYCTLYHDDVTSDSNASNLTEHCTDQRSYIVPSFMTYFTLVGLQTGKTYRIKVRSFGLEGRYVDSDQLEYRPQEWREPKRAVISRGVMIMIIIIFFLILLIVFCAVRNIVVKRRIQRNKLKVQHIHIYPELEDERGHLYPGNDVLEMSRLYGRIYDDINEHINNYNKDGSDNNDYNKGGNDNGEINAESSERCWGEHSKNRSKMGMVKKKDGCNKKNINERDNKNNNITCNDGDDGGNKDSDISAYTRIAL